MNNQSRSSGFTLTEILVVVVIIAILAAIAFPIFGVAREKAGAATCAANQRNLYLAISQFSDDTGRYPSASNEVVPGSGADPYVEGWSAQSTMEAYLGDYFRFGKDEENSKLFTCPSHGHRLAGVANPRTYAVNQLIFTKNADLGIRPVLMEKPAQTVMFADCTQSASGNGWPAFGSIGIGNSEDGTVSNPDLPIKETGSGGGLPVDGVDPGFLAYRHGKRANVTFGDGHMESIGQGRLKKGDFAANKP